ncbi:hypothetical protein [Burkholderia pseudomallei]|uniref:hypothetical protein n=1 Tax=Burkholderia pseudomallei TaxID=28450 RepID=UPI000B1C77B7|nr:hypothetical protein [Burkholderia pseudomallei]NAX51845.1 hypothetical protein [Burkholderia pseudomallei]NAX72000.1 hypothetical protein [Burkholderia pseudomallei]NAY57743.1 hypothetical protein [Burkholderia pseudomallei]NAY64064.1 hypothetical protein [Burkholderia pseudomallei]NAY70829.1 hypothetical protein [Burkholderia pseudomallei]
MDDDRLIEVTKKMKSIDIDIVRKAIDDVAERQTLLSSQGVTPDEFAEYLSQEITFKLDDVSIKRPRKQVIQAMHSCC